MSNPVATIGFDIDKPSDPSLTRKSYTSIIFENQDFFNYTVTEFAGTFDPSDKGQRFFMFALMDDAINTKPIFVTQEAWDSTVKKASSGFLTGRFSIMPKLMIPSKTLVDNGIATGTSDKLSAYTDPSVSPKVEAFNWKVNSVTGGFSNAEIIKVGNIGAHYGSQYVTIRAKSDSSATNEVEIQLDEPPVLGGSAPSSGGSSEGWNNSRNLVVDGAFTLLLNVTPSRPSGVNFLDVQDNPWTISIEFGEINMVLNESGAMKVSYDSGVASEDNEITVNLAEGKTKEGPPQQQYITDKQPFVIQVYPVWNGIIVMSGNQESPEVVNSASTFIPMVKGRSVAEDTFSDGFDPTNPGEVLIDSPNSGSDRTIPDFGTSMTLTAENCRFEVAYLPTFFCRELAFDQWFVASDTVPGSIQFDYEIYPIWTENDGDNVNLGDVTPSKTSNDGPVDDTSYYKSEWRMSMNRHDRHAGEIFGAVLETTEERDFPINNGNGSFNLSWSGGTAGDSSASNWEDYIQSINVSISLDGSSGSISVDKYGIAGQDAVADQDIGAITISVSGGEGTVGGSIFEGLAMGISESNTSDGSTWEIPLVGLETKMEDIALINVPFFDGETVTEAVDFLTRYAGIEDNFSNAPDSNSTRLSASEDINVARFDWKSGTTVTDALNDVMNDVNYEFVVRDGSVYIYELDDFGLPVFPGPDRSSGYSDTKIVSIDQNPDFDDMRNEIILIGLEPIPEGTGTKLSEIPSFPRFETRSTDTDPEIPWARSMVQALPGTFTQSSLSDIADKIQRKTSKYIVVGKTTIPGNADIRPWDRWDDKLIISVSHNIDFTAKTWTTDLEFAVQAREL